jgi:hypothetical protein
MILVSMPAIGLDDAKSNTSCTLACSALSFNGSDKKCVNGNTVRAEAHKISIRVLADRTERLVGPLIASSSALQSVPPFTRMHARITVGLHNAILIFCSKALEPGFCLGIVIDACVSRSMVVRDLPPLPMMNRRNGDGTERLNTQLPSACSVISMPSSPSLRALLSSSSSGRASLRISAQQCAKSTDM